MNCATDYARACQLASRTMKQASVSSTEHGGGKRRMGNQPATYRARTEILFWCLLQVTQNLAHSVHLEKLAKSTGRSFLAAEAISAYLDTNEWQVAGITTALSSLDRGKGIAHERVSVWVASWETRRERPAPKNPAGGLRHFCGLLP